MMLNTLFRYITQDYTHDAPLPLFRVQSHHPTKNLIKTGVKSHTNPAELWILKKEKKSNKFLQLGSTTSQILKKKKKKKSYKFYSWALNIVHNTRILIFVSD